MRGAKPVRRGSDYKVIRSLVAGYHRKPCQRIELPQSVKLLYRKPKDEEDWTKLADFRKLLRRIVQGEGEIILCSEEDAHDLALAIENCPRDGRWNTVGEGFYTIPAGSEIINFEKPANNDIDICRITFAAAIRQKEPGVPIVFNRRPWDYTEVKKAPIQDCFLY